MPSRYDSWLTVQQTAAMMDSTSAEVCRLLSIGRLVGSKQKQPGRPGKAQWLVDPRSVARERRRTAKRPIKRPKLRVSGKSMARRRSK
jgi:hypothetical protein